MKKTFVSQSAPFVLAVVLLASYASLLLGVPAVAASFADFKVEVPAPTLFAINLARFLTAPAINIAFAALMFGLAFAASKRERWSWSVGLVLTLFFSLNLISILMPMIAIFNGLNNGDAEMNTLRLLPYIGITTFVVFLPPLLFLSLRRAFLAAPAP